MHPEEFINRPEFIRWEASGLRITAFLAEQMDVTNIGWWQEVLGEQAENVSIKNRGQVREETGVRPTGNLLLKCEPMRTDWILTAPQDESGERVLPPVMPNLPEAIDQILEIADSWFKNCPDLQRMAFGAWMISPVDDHVSGYTQLDELLPNVTVEPSTRDFRYQLNRRRPSAVGPEGLLINRLSNWSLLRVNALGEFQVTLADDVRVVPTAARQEAYAVQADLDINTMAEFQGSLPRETLVDQFRELVTMGFEIACEGEVP
ncbi:MAG: hypothetical protein OXC93_09715 [Rhodospirillaceae bacterium]|nr:hypothetical protein [Rhodospirillaceae bacterium]